MVGAHQQVQLLPEIPTFKCRGTRTNHECHTKSRLFRDGGAGENRVGGNLPGDCLVHVCSFLLTLSFLSFNPFPNDKILDSSKFKAFADENFEFDDNGRKFSKWLENTVGKGEIARYEQFLLFPLCFQKTCNADM